MVDIEARLAKRKARRELLKANLAKILAQLRARNVEKVYLVGSFASGAVRMYSDLDLVVVIRDTQNSKVFARELYESLATETALDLLVYTETEFEAMLRESSFLRHAIKHGRLVYEAAQ
jgi:predicted nucleotidyltransferase